MADLPYNGSVEAEYKDGYVHAEHKHDDISPYTGTHNIFNDILEKRPEAEHGQMVRFSVYHDNHRYDVDWTTLPDNARPIRFKHMERDFDPTGNWTSEPRLASIGFGYQYNDEHGQNVQEIKEL